MDRKKSSTVFLFLALINVALADSASPSSVSWGDPGSDADSRVRPVIGTAGMVVSDDPIASEWGAEILRRGGNAIDAAVATGFMLAVTRPHFGSIGGGGFLVFCPAPRKVGSKPQAQKCVTIDYREKAPRGARRDMYLRNGKPNLALSRDGPLASGIPGVTAGLLTAQARWGRKTRQEILREPIRLAEEGFRRTGYTESGAITRWKALNAEARRILGCARGREAHAQACPAGTVLRQPDLGRVLREISSRGVLGFYRGWVARKIVEGIREAGGIFTIEDFYDYRPVIRAPLVGEFEGNEVVTMAPPSSGGALLLQMLGYVERAKEQGQFAEGFNTAKSLHAMAHAMALSFADRAKYFGDPDYFKVPVAGTLLTGYLDERWKTFNPVRANIPQDAGEVSPQGTNTTHFSVIDGRGNAVSVTTTINDVYGSGFVPPGTGIFMNNEMDDFSAAPGTPNLFGLVGSEANAIAPGKRPLSSMTPTIVRDQNGSVQMVIGGAGGPRIPSAVFDTLVARYIFGLSLPDAVAAPRIHEQWKPAELSLERYGFGNSVRARLTELGYKITDVVGSAKLHALERFSNGRVWGVPDPRGEGAAAAQ